MFQYKRKNIVTNDGNVRFEYYKYDKIHKKRKRISKTEYNNQSGGQGKASVIIKSIDNTPINLNIKDLTKIENNLLRQINELDLDGYFTRDKDLYINGVKYMAYKASKYIIDKLTNLNPSTIYRSLLNSFYFLFYLRYYLVSRMYAQMEACLK